MKSKLPGYIPLSILLRIYRFRKKKMLPEVFRKNSYRPWMRYEEIEVIEGLIKYLKPGRCLEWGAGYSTVFFPKILNKRAEWISIEHEKDWADKIRAINRNKNVKIHFVQPNRFPWTDENSDGAYSDLKDYVDLPSGGNFDLILIDGRARRACLEVSRKMLSDKGVVVLHDAQRQHYHDPFGSYKYQVMLRGYDKSGAGLWIGSMGLDLNNVIDAGRYEILWKKYRERVTRYYANRIFWHV